MIYDVIIVGGGASGLACALTLASSKGRGWQWAENRNYLLFDKGESDLNKAYLKNVPGLSATLGKDLIEKIKKQIQDWGGVQIIQEEVIEITNGDQGYTVKTSSGSSYSADYVVLATGFHAFGIKGLGLEVVENPKSPKPGRVMIKHKDFEALPNLFVVGTLAGISSHFTSCAGSGVEVACEILSRMAGKRIVIHDVPNV
ncbi:FAD-dependent oxidoreductase [Hydrogenobacter hydrogenophilus]|uniref:Pyridine nucleotide-disulphide oxidoreductase n=1 Tax=Hydrogenobacter hydrogenophilus TaxID=35835 RepID=A0A285NYY7_9AQUI|nr:FAD/NAD(P)-binding protein [Hydrogenobacter hydrogenophilus]SNZ14143.1 Pyridine nucleotide-disulphide oxidoreductase [Hydrogenobacter hydrogenophilus]